MSWSVQFLLGRKASSGHMNEMKREKAERERANFVSDRYPLSTLISRMHLAISPFALSLIDAGHEKFLSMMNILV